MNNMILMRAFILFLVMVLQVGIAHSQTTTESEGSGVKEFFRSLLFCGPGNKMCDKEYNPNAKNAMVESPEQLLEYINQAESFLSGKRESSLDQKRVSTPASAYVSSKSKIAVTAAAPSKLNPPLDNDTFQKLMKGNPSLSSAVQGYMQKKPESLPSLKLLSEAGDPFAQLFLGLAYGDEWTGMLNLAESCRWIKESATAGVSSARYFIAQKAYVKSPCFSENPTLDQAKIWGELASQSNDPTIKKDSQQLLLEILKAQIAGSK
jgi:TPR repeat protein